MGLVDQLVDAASLEAVAVEAAAALANGNLKPKKKPKALMNKLIEDNPVGRSVMWKKVRPGVLFSFSFSSFSFFFVFVCLV